MDGWLSAGRQTCTTIAVYNQPPRSTHPSTIFGVGTPVVVGLKRPPVSGSCSWYCVIPYGRWRSVVLRLPLTFFSSYLCVRQAESYVNVGRLISGEFWKLRQYEFHSEKKIKREEDWRRKIIASQPRCPNSGMRQRHQQAAVSIDV